MSLSTCFTNTLKADVTKASPKHKKSNKCGSEPVLTNPRGGQEEEDRGGGGEGGEGDMHHVPLCLDA